MTTEINKINSDRFLSLMGEIEQGYSFWDKDEENRKIIKNKFSEILEISDYIKENDPASYENIVKGRMLSQGLIKALSILNEDIREGFGEALGTLKEFKEETVVGLIEHFKTNKHYAWVGTNPTEKVKNAVDNLNDEARILQLVEEFLPSIKAEEMSDLLALAFSGKLSDNYAQITELPTIDNRVSYLKGLMAKERLYVKVDFSKLEVSDETENLRDSNNGYMLKSRALSSQGMIDSVYMNKDKTEMTCVIATSNRNTETQKDQLYKIYHTLNEVKNRGELKIDNSDNPAINLIFCNRAFFCTQDKESAISKHSAGMKGGTVEKEGFHATSHRAEFENLILKGKEVSKEEMDKINGLVTLSIIGNNLNYPRFPYTFEISDIIFANPVTMGSDTLWMKEKFDEIKLLNGQEREIKFFDFLINYSNETMDALNKLKSDVEISKNNIQSPLIKHFSESMNRLLEGISQNFSSYNLGDDGINEILENKIKNLESKVKEFNGNHPNIKIQARELKLFSSKDDFIEMGNEIKEARKVLEKQYCNNWMNDEKENEVENSPVKAKSKNPKNFRDLMLSFAQKILASDSVEDNQIKSLHLRVHAAISHLYEKRNILNKTDAFPVYNHFLAAASGLMSSHSSLDKAASATSLKNNTYYKKLTKFNSSSNSKRKYFNETLAHLDKFDPLMARKYRKVDKSFTEFVNKIANPVGAAEIIKTGGYLRNLQQLTNTIEDELKIKINKKPKAK